MRDSQGFSLVELLVVMAVLALLLAMGLPNFQTWLRNVQIRNAAESLQNGLQFARMEALRRNERVSFWMVATTDPKVLDDSCARSGSGLSWVVGRDDPAAACAAAASESAVPRILQKKAGGEGGGSVLVDASGAAGNASSCATFNGFGQVEAVCADAGASEPIVRVIFSAAQVDPDSRSLEVRLGAGGAIRMCDPAVTAAADPRFC